MFQLNVSNVGNSPFPRPCVPSISGFQPLPSVWDLKHVPGGLPELVRLCQSGCFWAPHMAGTNFLWAFEAFGAQAFLNCCVFRECPFVTVQWPIFFLPQSWWGWPARSHWGNDSERRAVGSSPHTWKPGQCSVFMEYFHFVGSILLPVQLQKIRWCHLFWFTC